MQTPGIDEISTRHPGLVDPGSNAPFRPQQGGVSYVHRDMHGNQIETSADAFAKVTTTRFPTPADQSSIVHEVGQVWPNARVAVVTEPAP